MKSGDILLLWISRTKIRMRIRPQADQQKVLSKKTSFLIPSYKVTWKHHQKILYHDRVNQHSATSWNKTFWWLFLPLPAISYFWILLSETFRFYH